MVLQKKNEFMQIFIEEGVDPQQRSIISYLIDKKTNEFIQGNIIFENLNDKFITYYIVSQTTFILIFDESIRFFDQKQNKIEVIAQGLKIKGCNFVNENTIYILDNESLSELKVESNGQIKKNEICKISTQLTLNSFKEAQLLQGSGNSSLLLGRQSDESLVICEIIQKKITSLRQIYVNYFFSVEYVKVLQELGYNYIYTSKRVTKYCYQLEKHFNQDTIVKSSQLFPIKNKLDSLFLTNQLETQCLNYNNQIYMVTDECLSATFIYKLIIKNDASLYIEANPDEANTEYQFLDKTASTLFLINKKIEYKTNKIVTAYIHITLNSLIMKVYDNPDQPFIVEVKLSSVFSNDIVFDKCFSIKDAIFLQVGDQIHILLVNYEGILQGEKDHKKFISTHLIHRLENDEEIEQIFNLNSYQLVGLKRFNSQKIEIYNFNREKKPYLKKIQDFELSSTDVITQVEEYSIILNNTNYIMKELSLHDSCKKLLILTNDDLIQNKMNPDKIKSELTYIEFQKIIELDDKNLKKQYSLKNVWQGDDKILWIFQDNQIVYIIQMNRNQIMDTNSNLFLENLQFEYRKLEIEDTSDSQYYDIVNTFMVNPTNIINVLQSKKDKSVKIQPMKIIPSQVNRNNFTAKRKRFNQKPIELLCIDDLESPLSMIILSQAEDGLFYINLFNKNFEIISVFELSAYTQITGLFYSVYCGIIGCFYGCEKYTIQPNTETISSFKETNLTIITLDQFIQKETVKSSINQEQWVNNFSKDTSRQFQKVYKFFSKINSKESYNHHIYIKDEILLKSQSLKDTSLFLFLMQDKIVLAHLLQQENNKEIILSFIFSFEWENSLYHVFKNEIPPQEIDMLEFMKDFKDNHQFKDMIMIKQINLSTSSSYVARAQFVVLTDDNQLNWLQLDTSLSSSIQSLANIKIDHSVDKVLCYNQETSCLLIQVNKSDIHQCKLIQQERTGRDIYELKIQPEIYQKNEQILDVALLNNYTNKQRKFSLKPHIIPPKNNLNTVVLKRGGLMEIYSSNNLTEQQFQGYL